MGELHVTAARVKTKKSKRRPGKSAHVAVDVKPVIMYIRSYDEILVIDAEGPSMFAPLPLPAFPGCGGDPTRGVE